LESGFMGSVKAFAVDCAQELKGSNIARWNSFI